MTKMIKLSLREQRHLYTNLPFIAALPHNPHAFIHLLRLYGWAFMDAVTESGDELLSRVREAHYDKTSSELLPDENSQNPSP